ncbi:MAG: glycosyltransferase [Baekduia sp.]
MIVFATSVTKRDVYDTCAARGIKRVAEPDSEVWAIDAPGSLFHSYNSLLDRAAGHEGLEALVLLHQDTELVDDDFCARIRDAIADPEVGLAGCVGSVGVRTIAWWDGSVTLASFMHKYDEHGGGGFPGFSWDRDGRPPYARTGDVDTVDGFLLVLSPWVVDRLRFDESLGQLHGYDFDFCLQVREAGKRVVTADVRAIHHHSLDLVSNPETWIEAHMAIAEKWQGRMPDVGWEPGSWEQRARRAEAVRDLHLSRAWSNEMRAGLQMPYLEHALHEARTSVSWRITAPVRVAQGVRRRIKERS